MIDLTRNIINSGIFQGVICNESASYWNGLSTFPPTPLTLFTPRRSIKSKYLVTYDSDTYPRDKNDLIKIRKNVYVTNPYLTVCDMIRYECDLDFTLQVVEFFLDNKEELEKLNPYLEKYHCREEFLRLKEIVENDN